MKNNLKRGQAAMEFLTTYGWAVLVIVLVLAALIWLGVFNTNQAVPDRCTFEPGLYCESIKLMASPVTGGYVVDLAGLSLKNQFGEKIVICGLDFRTGNTPQGVPDASICANSGLFVSPNENMKFAGGTFRSASLGPSRPLPMMFLWLELLQYIALMNPAKEGDSLTDPVLLANPGQMLEANLFIYYLKESDGTTGKARVAKGVIVARVN